MNEIKKLKKKRLNKLVPRNIKEGTKGIPGIRYKVDKNGDIKIYANFFTMIADLFIFIKRKIKNVR